MINNTEHVAARSRQAQKADHMRLFISYAHDDKGIVEQLVVKPLRAGGHDVWNDDRIPGGAEWKKTLSKEIKKGDALVFCITSKSIDSEWCRWELDKAAKLCKRVVPVMVQKTEPLPDYLSHLQYVDFTDGDTGNSVARLMGGLQWVRPPTICHLRRAIRVFSLFMIALAIIAGLFGLWQSLGEDNTHSTQTSAENLRLYRDEESLTLYVPDGQSLNPDNWSLGTNLRAEQELSDFFGQSPISGPACLRLEYQNATINNHHDDVCPDWDSDQYPVVRLSLADVFWYNRPLNWHYAIEIYFEDALHTRCEANVSMQEIQFAQQPAQIQSNSEGDLALKIALISGILAILAEVIGAVIVGLFGLWEGVFSNNTNSD